MSHDTRKQSSSADARWFVDLFNQVCVSQHASKLYLHYRMQTLPNKGGHPSTHYKKGARDSSYIQYILHIIGSAVPV